MFGQTLVEEREVGRHETRQAEIILEHVIEKQVRFFDHCCLQHLVELRVEPEVGRGEVDVAQVQPLAEEVLGERPCL